MLRRRRARGEIGFRGDECVRGERRVWAGDFAIELVDKHQRDEADARRNRFSVSRCERRWGDDTSTVRRHVNDMRRKLPRRSAIPSRLGEFGVRGCH